jgi:hypothetical protein
MSLPCVWKRGTWFTGPVPVVPVVPTATGLFVVSPEVTRRRDGRSLVAVAFSPSRVAAVRTRAGAKNPKAPRASADPGSPRAAILSDFLRIAYNSTIEPDYASR